jgi:hypothetical protein
VDQVLGWLAPFWGKIAGGFVHGEAPAVSILELVLVVLVAAAVSVPPVTWRFFALFVNVVHELGHACASIMTGRIVTGIKLRFDHSGTTMSYGRIGGISEVWATFWGYPVPAVVGAALVWTALTGWASAALSVSAIILLLTILAIRNWAGLAIISTAASVSVAMVWFASAEVLGHVTLALGIALLVGSVRDWVKVLSVHTSRRDELETSDAHILYRETGIPSPAWLVLFAVPILGAWFVAGSATVSAVMAAGLLH